MATGSIASRFRSWPLALIGLIALTITIISISSTTAANPLKGLESVYTPSLERMSPMDGDVLDSVTTTQAPAAAGPIRGTPAAPAPTKDPLTVIVPIDSHAHWATDSYRAARKSIIQAAAKEVKEAVAGDYSKTLSGGGRYTRGVVVYFDPKSDKYKTELKAMSLSIAYMRLTQPSHIKTDIVIFAAPSAFDYLHSIGCAETQRKSFEDSERCVIIPYVPLTGRAASDTLGSDPLLQYKFAESVNVVAELPDDIYYDLVIRSDMDTFFTPGFSDYIPAPGVTVVGYGGGGYESKYAMNHMSWIMTTLGLTDAKIKGLGSTWYGPLKIVKRVSKLSVELMRWLYTQEYTEYDRQCFCWPEWYWVVTTMYSGYMALHQVGPDKLFFDKIDEVLFDGYSTGAEKLKPALKHIHCWHTDDFYSKLAHQAGKYKDKDISEYVHMSSREAYAGVLAISAERLKEAEFKAMIYDADAIRSKKWVRPLPV